MRKTDGRSLRFYVPASQGQERGVGGVGTAAGRVPTPASSEPSVEGWAGSWEGTGKELTQLQASFQASNNNG